MKTVIEMAHKAGMLVATSRDSLDQLERFAALVRADERERIEHAAIGSVKAAILYEREACAKVCDEQVERSRAARDKSNLVTQQRIYHAGAQTSAWNAAAIRARGSNT